MSGKLLCYKRTKTLCCVSLLRIALDHITLSLTVLLLTRINTEYDFPVQKSGTESPFAPQLSVTHLHCACQHTLMAFIRV